MDLEYLLKGIKDGTVSIVNLSSKKDNKCLCNDISPSEVRLKMKYIVVRFEKEIIGEKIGYLISVLER